MTWLPQIVSGSLQFTFAVSLVIRIANFQFFAKKGITLENFFAVTHPSEPNYMAAVGGEYLVLMATHLRAFHPMSPLLLTYWRTRESPGACTNKICPTVDTRDSAG
jgi:hypothetical protein